MSEKKKQEALEAGYDMSKSFANKSVWARIAVIAAGPIFNFILAFVCSVVKCYLLVINLYNLVTFLKPCTYRW